MYFWFNNICILLLCCWIFLSVGNKWRREEIFFCGGLINFDCRILRLFLFSKLILVLFNIVVYVIFLDCCIFFLRIKGLKFDYRIVFLKVYLFLIGFNWRKFFMIIIFIFLNGLLLFLIEVSFLWMYLRVCVLIIEILLMISVWIYE